MRVSSKVSNDVSREGLFLGTSEAVKFLGDEGRASTHVRCGKWLKKATY